MANSAPSAPVVLKNPNTQDFKDKAAWEMFDSEFTSRQYGVPPGRPYVYREYPRMLIRAQRVPGGFPKAGTWATSLQEPAFFGFRDQDEWERACQFARNFTKSCQREVADDREHKQARESGEGWRDSVEEALAWGAEMDKMVSDAAAQRAYADRNMSEKAKAEVEKVEAAQEWGHVAEVKEQPIKRRPGRPKKNTAA